MSDAMILLGIGKIDGDGWKDVTKKGEKVLAWNTELPRPYKAGQYPRVGNEGWSASTDQYDFRPATLADLQELLPLAFTPRTAPDEAAPE